MSPTASVPELLPFQQTVQSEDLDDWQLTPSPQTGPLAGMISVTGRVRWQAALAQFLSNHVQNYSHGRDIPAEPNTSRLSPYLRFGNISPRQFGMRLKR